MAGKGGGGRGAEVMVVHVLPAVDDVRRDRCPIRPTMAQDEEVGFLVLLAVWRRE